MALPTLHVHAQVVLPFSTARSCLLAGRNMLNRLDEEHS